jgi:hypothetical protein
VHSFAYLSYLERLHKKGDKMRGYIKDRTYYKRERESGKLVKFDGAWSINLDEVSVFDFDKIVYTTEKAIYECDIETAETRGFSKFFGGENKLIIPAKCWTKTERGYK